MIIDDAAAEALRRILAQTGGDATLDEARAVALRLITLSDRVARPLPSRLKNSALLSENRSASSASSSPPAPGQVEDGPQRSGLEV